MEWLCLTTVPRGAAFSSLATVSPQRGTGRRGFLSTTCSITGSAGDTTDMIVARLGAVVDARPDAIAFMAGTNDLAMRKSVEHLVRNIEYALVAIRRDLPGVRMLLQSILPRGREFADAIQDANRHLRQFAPNVRAQYLDLWPTFAQRRRRDRSRVLRRSLAPEPARLRGVARRTASSGRPAG